MKHRILFQIIAPLAIVILSSCAPAPKGNMETKTPVTSEAAQSIAIKYLGTIMDSKAFLPDSTKVGTWAVNPDYWSVFIKKSSHEIPPEFLISVHKTTGKPNFEPLD